MVKTAVMALEREIVATVLLSYSVSEGISYCAK